MNKYSLYFLVALFCSLIPSRTLAQSSLAVYRTFGGVHFEYTKDTMTYSVSPRQVSQILMDDPLAYEEFKKARSKSTLSGVLGFAGVVLIAIPAGTSLAGGDPEWTIAAGGAALVLSSIPLNRAFKRQTMNAVDMYNEKHRAFRPRAEYFFSGLGARILIRF